MMQNEAALQQTSKVQHSLKKKKKKNAEAAQFCNVFQTCGGKENSNTCLSRPTSGARKCQLRQKRRRAKQKGPVKHEKKNQQEIKPRNHANICKL